MNVLKWNPSVVHSELINDRLVIKDDCFTLDDEQFDIDGTETHKFQTPNWGKESTQVQTIGKHSKIVTDDLKVEEIGQTTHCWRSDEEYFAIQKNQQLYIYNEDGDLFSKHAHKISNSICWYKHRVVTIQRRREKLVAVFVEPNGLEHGAFNFHNNNLYVTKMRTNEDQNMLYVEVQSLNCSENKILIYQCMNDKWYILNTISVQNLKWYLYENTINIYSNTNKIALFPILTTVSNEGIVAMINGNEIFVTNMNLACVPPPYAHLIINFPEEILDCVLYNSTLYSLSRHAYYETKLEFDKGLNIKRKFDMAYELPEAILIGNITYENEILISLISPSLEGKTLSSTGKIFSIISSNFNQLLHAQAKTFISGSTIFKNDFELKTSTPILSTLYDSSLIYLSEDRSLSKISLDSLSVELISPNVRSFIVYGDYLITTKFDDTLEISSLVNINLNWFREVEFGASIVTMCGDKIIIHLPRGNIEIFYPRPFIILSIIDEMKRLNMFLAVELCRKHRIDFNIIFDIKGDVQEKIENIVQHCSPERINLILTALSNSNSFLKFYKEESVLLQIDHESMKNKVKCICGIFREFIYKKNGNSLLEWRIDDLQALVTAFIRDSNNIQSAIHIIKEIYSDKKKALDLLKYCIFLTDKSILYKSAFETYDLEFVQFVARYCDIDPKEYLSFIDRVKLLSPHEQRFLIDIEVENYGKAAVHLIDNSEDIEKICSHISHFNCYKIPIHHLIKNKQFAHSCWSAIWELYAFYLQSKKQRIAAAICFFLAKKFDSAMELFAEQKYYNESFACIKLSGRNNSNDLIELLEIFGDHIGIYNVLCINKLTPTDMQLVGTTEPFINYVVANDTLLLIEKYNALLIELNNYLSKVESLANEIKHCRAEMESKLKDLENEEFFEIDDINSVKTMETSRSTLVSQVTGLSRLTFKTGKTVKSKRKSDKKQQSGRRKGTIYQEVYLINEFIYIVNSFNEKLVEYQHLHTQLFLSYNFGEAFDLYKQIYSLYETLHDAKATFDHSFFSKQMTVLGRSNSVSKQDLVEYSISVTKPLDFPALASKPVWIHFQ
eukprot:NODE_4_length_77007_cov_1.156642.p1 type:complete len:1068 gc:universal NODE_4_length_77007_cov_1.156642:38241-35038(-)